MTHSTQNRYYTAIHGADPKGQGELRRLNNFIAGEWKPSRTAVYRDAFNPSTGEVIAKVPASLPDELNSAVAAAREAFPGMGRHPRVQTGERTLPDEGVGGQTPRRARAIAVHRTGKNMERVPR